MNNSSLWIARVTLTVCLMLAGTMSAAQGPQSQDWFLSLDQYPQPEAAINTLREQIETSLPGKSPQIDAACIRLAYLYRELGRYDEASTILFPLWMGLSSDQEITAAAKVLWPLIWSDVARSKAENERLDSLNQLVIAAKKVTEIKSPRLWAALSRIVKNQRFASALELVPMASELDRHWSSTVDGTEYSRDSLLMLLSILAPEVFQLSEDGQNSVPTESLQERMGTARPWKDALLRIAEILAVELRNLDQLVWDNAEVATASYMNREAAVLSARGKMREAIPLRRAAAARFQVLGHADERMNALAGAVGDGLALGTPEDLIAVLPDSVTLIAMHEERQARLGSLGSRYQVRHFDAYRNHRDLLLQLAGTTSRLPPEMARHITTELVLHADRMQLRPARREMAIFRALAGNEAMRKRLAVEVAGLKPTLKAAEKELSLAQTTTKVTQADLRSGDPRGIVDIIRKAGEHLYLESGTVSTSQPMTAETGPYVNLKAASQAIRDKLNATGGELIGSTGKAIELPADWKALMAGMTADDGLVAFIETGSDRPLQAAVITNSDVPRIIDLPGATHNQLIALVESARDEILKSDTSGRSEALAKLARILWHPLGAMPRRLTIVPNLLLVGFPFEALPYSDGRLVVDAHSIRYALGLDDRIGQHAVMEPFTAALVMGVEESRYPDLAPLTDARKEVATIRVLMEQAKVRILPANPLPRTGSDLLEPAPAVGLVHVATHSILDKNDTFIDRLTFPDEDILAVELATSPLRAKIAIFGACSLLSNRKKGTQPVSGLTTASLAVVAPQVVATFWDVESQATRVFMTAFYENLLRVREPAQALVETKRLFRDPVRFHAWTVAQSSRLGDIGDVRKYAHPYYWAAFGLVVRTPD